MTEKVLPPFEEVVVVGLGGIWSRLWLNAGDISVFTEGAPKRFLLIDGDDIEERNMARQGFLRSDIGKKKAQVYEERMKRRYPELSIRSRGEFLTDKNIDELIPARSIVLSCLDNNKTRLLLFEHAKKLSDVAMITGGNELWDGSVHAFVREGGVSRTKSQDEIHDSIRNPKDKNPGEISCAERLAQKGGEQVLVTNAMVAAHMAAMFYDVLSTWAEWKVKEVGKMAEVFFDVKNHSALGYLRIPEKSGK